MIGKPFSLGTQRSKVLFALQFTSVVFGKGLQRKPFRSLQSESEVVGFLTDDEVCDILVGGAFGKDACTCGREGEEFSITCKDICETCEEDFDACTKLVHYERRHSPPESGFEPMFLDYTYDQTGLDSSKRSFRYQETNMVCMVYIDGTECTSCSQSSECDNGHVFNCSNIDGIEESILDTCSYLDQENTVTLTNPFYSYFNFDVVECLEDLNSTPLPSETKIVTRAPIPEAPANTHVPTATTLTFAPSPTVPTVVTYEPTVAPTIVSPTSSSMLSIATKNPMQLTPSSPSRTSTSPPAEQAPTIDRQETSPSTPAPPVESDAQVQPRRRETMAPSSPPMENSSSSSSSSSNLLCGADAVAVAGGLSLLCLAFALE